MGFAIGLGFILLVGSYYIGRACFSRFKDDPAKGACLASSYMNNSAFMGIPVVQTFFPGNPEPLIYVSMFGVAFGVLSWTLLVYAITGNKKYIRVKAAFVNPGMVTLLASIPLLIFDINPPPVLANVISTMANMTTPLAMLIVGIRLAEIPFKELFNSPKVYLSSLIKLVFIPIFSLGVLLVAKNFLPITSTMALTLFIIMAMPSASFVIIFSEKFNGDRPTAVKCVLLSSLLSIITIPVLMIFSNLL
jgi:predicted permease